MPSACSRLVHPASGLTWLTAPRWLRLLKIKLASHVNLLAHYAKGTLSLMLQLLQLTPSFEAAHGWQLVPEQWGRPHLSLAVLALSTEERQL